MFAVLMQCASLALAGPVVTVRSVCAALKGPTPLVTHSTTVTSAPSPRPPASLELPVTRTAVSTGLTQSSPVITLLRASVCQPSNSSAE